MIDSKLQRKLDVFEYMIFELMNWYIDVNIKNRRSNVFKDTSQLYKNYSTFESVNDFSKEKLEHFPPFILFGSKNREELYDGAFDNCVADKNGIIEQDISNLFNTEHKLILKNFSINNYYTEFNDKNFAYNFNPALPEYENNLVASKLFNVSLRDIELIQDSIKNLKYKDDMIITYNYKLVGSLLKDQLVWQVYNSENGTKIPKDAMMKDGSCYSPFLSLDYLC